MAITIELEPLGPGRGRLLVSGGPREAESVSLAIQRNDGRFLGLERQWQVTPHWHPQFAVEPRGEGLGLGLEIGPDLVDGIIGVGGAPLRLVLRIDGADHAGVLRIRGTLVGSDAAAPLGSPPQSGAARAAGRAQETAPDTADPPPDGVPTADATPTAPVIPRRAVWPWIAAALTIALLGGAGIGAWWLGLLGPALQPLAQDEPPPAPPEPQPPEPVPPTPAPALTGIALARDFLAGHPDGEAVFARAEQAEREGDCPGAFALYSEAANQDPRLAARLARRYDPLTHTNGRCIEAPDVPYAIVYFTDAAEAGDPTVRRRLGQLLVERETSGPTHEAGIEWLNKAATAGDQEARKILESLGGQ